MGLLSQLAADLRNTSLAQPRGHRQRQRPAAPRLRPSVQALEDRRLLSGYQQTNLVGYQPGIARSTDPNLNGWGMVSMPDGSFVVANAFTTGLATFYKRSGHVLPRTITVPASAAQPFGPVGHPTDVVYNPTKDFVISANGKSAPARLIFDSIDGTISGWNPHVDPNAGDRHGGHRCRQPPLRLHRAGHRPEQPGAECPVRQADIEQNPAWRCSMATFKAIGSFTDPTVSRASSPSFRSHWSVTNRETTSSTSPSPRSREYAWRCGGRVRYRRPTTDSRPPSRRQRLRRGPAGKPVGSRPGSGQLRRV